MREPPRDDEFFVGYRPAMPPGAARFVRARVLGILGFAACAAAALPAAQREPAVKFFEWGRPRTFVGVLEAAPAPTLLVRRPGVAEGADAWSRYLLVSPGKHGAADAVAPLAGRMVRLEGSLLWREGRTMVEIVPGSIRALDPAGPEAAPVAAPERLGRHTLLGEIVDSKCYLGAMEPGDTKPHRACAIRCIAGGIPPVFLVRERGGRALYFLLVGAKGEAVNREALPFVAEPLVIEGEVERSGDRLVLKADPSAWRRAS